jgi:hypothetical protein
MNNTHSKFFFHYSMSGLTSVFFAAFIFLCQFSSAQFFERIYPNTGIAHLGSLDDCIDSGFIVSGSNVSSILMKVKADGDTEWIRNDAGSMVLTGGVIQNAAGEFVVIGSGPAQLYSWVARVSLYDSFGNFLSADSILPVDGWGTAGISIARSPNRDFFHYWYYSDGYTADNNTILDNGDILGGDMTNVSANSVSVSDAGGYAAAGNLLFDMDTAGVWRNNILRLSGNENGYFYFDTDFSACSVTDDGGAMVAGMYDTLGSAMIRLVRFDASSNPVNDIFIPDTTLSFVYDIKQTDDGGFAILCSGTAGSSHIVFMAVDSLGTVKWKNDYYGYGTASPVNFRILYDGFVILGVTNNDPYIIRTDSLGRTSTTTVTAVSLRKESVTLFPNPSNGIISLSAEESRSRNFLMTVYDVTGRNVFRSEIQEPVEQLDLSFLAKGVYQFTLTASGEELKSGKFVIE